MCLETAGPLAVGAELDFGGGGRMGVVVSLGIDGGLDLGAEERMGVVCPFCLEDDR